MAERIHTIRDYQDDKGYWHWQVLVPGEDIISQSAQGYKERADMLNDLYGQYFGAYDDSFLDLYQQWNPNGDNGTPIGQQPEQPAITFEQ